MILRLSEMEPIDLMKRQEEHDVLNRFMKYLNSDHSLEFPGKTKAKSMPVDQCCMGKKPYYYAKACLLSIDKVHYQKIVDSKKPDIGGEYGMNTGLE